MLILVLQLILIIRYFLGIKNTNLDPVWIKTLPSGVAVYQSVFKDIWGSDLIFAGPHITFTKVRWDAGPMRYCFKYSFLKLLNGIVILA